MYSSLTEANINKGWEEDEEEEVGQKDLLQSLYLSFIPKNTLKYLVCKLLGSCSKII